MTGRTCSVKLKEHVHRVGVVRTSRRRWCGAWRMEAVIDFAETEGDVELSVSGAALSSTVERVAEEIRRQLNDGHRGEILRSGMYIPIVGAPNVGKSSLLNALAKRDVAIVSSTAGTTRDSIEVSLNIGGYPVVLVDTAGLRSDAADHIEEVGIARAKQRLAASDFCIWMFDIGALSKGQLHDDGALSKEQLHDDDDDAQALGHARETFADYLRQHGHQQSLVVLNKIDLHSTHDQQLALPSRADCARFFGVDESRILLLSCQTEAGLDGLLTELSTHVGEFFNEHAGSSSVITRERHRYQLSQCVDHLTRFLDFDPAVHPEFLDIAAEELRQAALCIGRISGRIEIEEVLDVLFKEFCIGK